LDNILRLLHPVMPFLTEELWQKLRPRTGSIMAAAWPEPGETRDAGAEAVADRFQDLVTSLRRSKVDHDLPQGRRLRAFVAAHDHRSEVESLSDAIVTLARLESLELVDALPGAGAQARTVTTAGIEAALDLGGAIDVERFVSKAPPEVVAKERHKLEEHQEAKIKLEAQLRDLG
jgi:valyl-tRNA synthetase